MGLAIGVVAFVFTPRAVLRAWRKLQVERQVRLVNWRLRRDARALEARRAARAWRWAGYER
jgi:hypothetical protein